MAQSFGRVWWLTRYALFAAVGGTAGLAVVVFADQAGWFDR